MLIFGEPRIADFLSADVSFLCHDIPFLGFAKVLKEQLTICVHKNNFYDPNLLLNLNDIEFRIEDYKFFYGLVRRLRYY